MQQRGVMDELWLEVSGVFERDGKKQASVRYTGRGCFAEGTIPDCVITRSEGFTDEEKARLEDFLRANLTDLKRRAARINPLDAFLGRTGGT